MTEPTRIRLDDLIAAIRKQHDDPLDQLADAMVAADHLGEIADSLIGHFVDQARRAGASWTSIGASMGVSKQAAQKRFVSRTSPAANAANDADNPFSRFTPRAGNVLMAAHSRAVAANAAQVSPAHIADALAAEPDALAMAVLRDNGIGVDDLHTALAPLMPIAPDRGPDATSLLPYDNAAKAVIESTVAIAVELGHNYVGTEQLLLGLFTDDAVAEKLRSLGVDSDDARASITAMLEQLGSK